MEHNAILTSKLHLQSDFHNIGRWDAQEGGPTDNITEHIGEKQTAPFG
jgi:hypothetical protein